MEPLTANFWLTEAALLYTVVFGVVDEAARRGVLSAAMGIIQALLGVREPTVDYDLLNEAAHNYADAHTFALVSRITDTSRGQLQAAFTEWIASGEPLPGLTERLAPMFGPVRAEAIAVTEITRVYHASNVIGWREFGVDTWQFQTAVDDTVCPKCGPLHGNEYSIEDEEHAPPIHVRCRCYSKPVVRVPEWVN